MGEADLLPGACDVYIRSINSFLTWLQSEGYLTEPLKVKQLPQAIQDPALNLRYVDYYYFGYNLDMGLEGENVWRFVMFYGRGPRKNWTTQMLTVNSSIDANIALEMPRRVRRN